MEAFTDKVKETFGWLLPFHPGWSHCNYVINLLSPGTFGINGVLKRCVIKVKSPVRMQENDRRILEEIGKEEWNTHWERERSEVNNESYTTSTHTTRIRQMPPIQDLNYVESSNLNYLH